MTIAPPPPTNIENRSLYICDNLRVMRGINSNSIDLIATDPPFNSKRDYNAPLGSKLAKQKFSDKWRWDDVANEWHDLIATDWPSIKELIEAAIVIEGGTVDEHTKSIDTGRVKNSTAAFLVWMAPRLIEMRRILKPTGSIYLHCDSSANAYLRLLMDAVFGASHFIDEIIWRSGAGKAKGSQYAPRSFGRDCDSIFHYAKTKDYVHNGIYIPLTEDEEDEKFPEMDNRGRKYNTGTPIFRQPSMGARPNLCYTYKGVTNPHPSGWRVSLERLKEMDANGEIIWRQGKRPLRKAFAENYKGKPIGSLWIDISPEAGYARTDWSTQKPVALYERIILASSNEGDLVLDPFAGCATTCVAAERQRRCWIGIDIDPEAETATKNRLQQSSGLDQHIGEEYVETKARAPKRTDIEYISDDKMRLLLWKKQSRQCANWYCTLKHVARHVDLHLDHVIPKSRGGSDDILNRIGLCGNCNSRKGRKAWGSFLDDERAKQAHPKVGQ